MSLKKNLKLKGMDPIFPIIQGGMGIGVSLSSLSGAVGRQGGIGAVSSVALDQYVSKKYQCDSLDFVEATSQEIEDTKTLASADGKKGVAAINIMVYLQGHYERSVKGAVEGEVNMIISGAGLPLNLPSLVEKYAGKDHSINLVPIISSARAFSLLCKQWDKQGYRPDAAVLEEARAGGHIGWNYKQIGEDFLENNTWEKLLTQPGENDKKGLGSVLDVAEKYPNDYGAIPIIAAGGIYSHDDIVKALNMGASGVQIGTRFAATEESGFTNEAKRIIIESKKEDIILAPKSWQSPCGLPFRLSKLSPLYQDYLKNGEVKEEDYFCICAGLMAATGMVKKENRCPEGYVILEGKCGGMDKAKYLPLVTMGTEAYRINEILSVEELMDELIG